MKSPLITVVGNRPQFVKMLPVSRALAAHGKKEYIIHTGQHHDDSLSEIFFRELKLPRPDFQMRVTASTHGAMTGELLTQLEASFTELKPRAVLLYGDTNSTLAAALAAAKLHIPIAHVEAGPRMRDMRLPEEVNRTVTDHLSSLLFCADNASVENLARENITRGVYFTGDVMLDSFLICKNLDGHAPTWRRHSQLKDGFIFLTLHRPGNVDTPSCLDQIYEFMRDTKTPILFPVHLRTRKRLEQNGLLEKFAALSQHVLTPPMGYLDTVAALTHCGMVVTDSGGLQKEAFYARKPAVVLLDETPWPDLQSSSWQRVIGTVRTTTASDLAQAMRDFPAPAEIPDCYGNGTAGERIVQHLIDHQFVG